MATFRNQLVVNEFTDSRTGLPVANCPDTPEAATLKAAGATAGLPGREALKHARNAVAAARGVGPGDPADHHRGAAVAHEGEAVASYARREPEQAERARDEVTRSPLDVLADRELEVFRLIGASVKTAEIAERLHLSVKTVETYRDRIRKKLGLSDGTQLAHYATQWVLENG
jgi:DNA-binding NarL/FixJ family response regulator